MWFKIWTILCNLYIFSPVLKFWRIWFFKGWWWRTLGVDNVWRRHINDGEVVCGSGYNEPAASFIASLPHRKAWMVEHNLNDHLMERLRCYDATRQQRDKRTQVKHCKNGEKKIDTEILESVVFINQGGRVYNVQSGALGLKLSLKQ